MEYITELYEDHREQMPKFEVISGARIMKEEIQKTLKSMKDEKASGPVPVLCNGLWLHRVITSRWNMLKGRKM